MNVRRRCAKALYLAVLVCPLAGPLRAQDAPPQRDAATLGVPFERYFAEDRYGRRITLYLSTAPAGAARLPVALFIEGSGCQSLIRKHGDHVAGGYQNILQEVARGRARVLAVEKPGVHYLDAGQRPGTAEGASEEFLREHTLPRWA